MIDCYCDYDPPAEFYGVSIRKARKQHRCEECGRYILPGERYEKVVGKWEGEVSGFNTCTHCLDIRTFVKNSVPCFCWFHGSMLDDAREAIEWAYDRASDEVRGLFMGFGRLVVAGRRARAAIAKAEPTHD